MKKMKKWQRNLVVAAVVLLMLFAVGEIFLHSLGKVTVPHFEKIAENTYAYSEGLNQSNMYLVLGEEKAMLIDTANGLSDLPAGIAEITDLPVFVVNTHGHYDHTRGNHWFETTYMSVKDDQVFKDYNKPETLNRMMGDVSPFIKFIMKYQTKTITETEIKEDYLPLPEEGYFDLGGRTLEIVELSGHTPGCIGLLDRESGELFCGDAITSSGVLMQLPESLTMAEYIDTLDVIQELIDDGSVKAMYSGHGKFEMDLSLVQQFKENCSRIMSGELTDKERENGVLENDGYPIKFDLNKVK